MKPFSNACLPKASKAEHYICGASNLYTLHTGRNQCVRRSLNTKVHWYVIQRFKVATFDTEQKFGLPVSLQEIAPASLDTSIPALQKPNIHL